MRKAQPSDAGETLLEILISMAILGLVLTALVAGLTTSIIGGSNHRHLTDVEIAARAYGEALVQQAYHPASTTLASAASSPSTTLTVSSLPSGLPPVPFYIAVDGEVLQVTALGAGNVKWTLGAASKDDHASGATVTYDALYDACVYPSHLAPSSFSMPAGLSNVSTPSIDTTSLAFYSATADSSGNLTASSVSNCATSWTSTLPCSKFASAEHLTNCDPGILRATITASNTPGTKQSASTTTRVLVRRGNA